MLASSKSGQVTIFIIIAVLIVAGVGIYFLVKNSVTSENKIPEDILPIQTEVLNCLETTTKEGLAYLSLHGGYYEVPEDTSIHYFTEDIPYYYLDSKKFVPSVRGVEVELDKYLVDNLRSCVDLKNFEGEGYNITEGNLQISSAIMGREVFVKANYPLTIRKDSVIRLKDFEVEVGSNAWNLLNSSNEIVNFYAEKPGLVCLTCLEEISNKSNVEIKVTPVQDVSVFDSDIIWFSVSEKNDFSINKLVWTFVVEQ